MLRINNLLLLTKDEIPLNYFVMQDWIFKTERYYILDISVKSLFHIKTNRIVS